MKLLKWKCIVFFEPELKITNVMILDNTGRKTISLICVKHKREQKFIENHFVFELVRKITSTNL